MCRSYHASPYMDNYGLVWMMKLIMVDLLMDITRVSPSLALALSILRATACKISTHYGSIIVPLIFDYLKSMVSGIMKFPKIACKNGAVREGGDAKTTSIPLSASKTPISSSCHCGNLRSFSTVIKP